MRYHATAAASSCATPRTDFAAIAAGAAAALDLAEPVSAKGVNWELGCFNRPWTKWPYAETLKSVKAAGYRITGLLTRTKEAPFIGADATPEYLEGLKRAIADNAPYVALTVALCATRLIPPLRDFLKPLWALKPYDNQPAFAPLYAPGFWLLSIGIVVVFQARASLARVTAETAKGAWRSCAVTLAFVVMAELYVGSGMAQQIAEALRAVAGRGAALSVPLFAATGGFLTGGGSAAIASTASSFPLAGSP